jgi:hypothetical protein
MHTQTIIVGLLMGLAVAGLGQAQVTQTKAPASCTDNTIDWTSAICFDGDTGTFYGSHRFLRRDTVRVWVCNLQPDTTYKVTVDEQVVAETALQNLPLGLLEEKLTPPPPSCSQLATLLRDPFTARKDTVTVQSKKTGDKDFKNLSPAVVLTMGQPLFALSAGFAGTPLGKTSYQTLGAAGSSSGSTIGLQEQSASRIQPMGFLNASLRETRGWCCSAHLTAGFTLTNNKLSTNPEFLFGPSIGMLNEQLFITAGAYGGFQGSLQSPYTFGGAAPTGTIPTLNQFHWKAGFAISWRVPSFGSSNNKSATAGQTPVPAKAPAKAGAPN